jgi:transcriptional regulator with XRE-family HTH domain
MNASSLRAKGDSAVTRAEVERKAPATSATPAGLTADAKRGNQLSATRSSGIGSGANVASKRGQTLGPVGDFGQALRVLRASVEPEDFGFAALPRRTPGMRREELAALASVSVEYLKRLEQNRAHPSPQVIAALATGLRLSHTQHEHLSRLAGFTPTCSERLPDRMTAGVERFVARSSQTPIAVFDAAWTLIGSNPLGQVLLSSLTEAEGRERNLIWRRFSDIDTAVVATPEHEERFEAALVADLRVVAARYPADKFVASLVADLAATSPRFAGLWERGEVAHHEPARKTLTHPLVGELTLDCDVMTVADCDLRVIVYTAEPGSDHAAKLERLSRLCDTDAPEPSGLP